MNEFSQYNGKHKRVSFQKSSKKTCEILQKILQMEIKTNSLN